MSNDNRELIETFYIKQFQLLKIFALWQLPEDSPTYQRLAYLGYFWFYLIFWMLLFDCGMIIQIATHLGDVNEVIKVLIIFATAVAMLGKYFYLKVYNNRFKEVFEMMHRDEFLPQNAREWRLYCKAVELARRVRNYYGTLSVSALSGLLLSLFLGEEKELPASIYHPFVLDTNFKYSLMYLYQCLSLACVCFINIGFDSLTASFLINIRGQLDVLGFRLETIGLGELDQRRILGKLKDCIKYYQCILELTHRMEELVCIPMSLQVGGSVFVLIANFYSMSMLSDNDDMGNFVKLLLYQTCMLTQIFILCYFANEVSLKSSEISFNLYESNWYDWDKVNRKLVLLMMIRFDTPIRIKSVNRCYSFNLAAFTSIVNSSYSYFALLKRINS
ncbi:odorant receptor 46a-like [Musca vetustissima]|uniref:odorant receptor 46a-like n=1 Tax=Musca vetustissima TaxID=27455 RepID=UPI002AB6494A|nr:odorant receptor 46a-like [Musca vetustissima]